MSRKNKTLRAFLHQNPKPTVEQAWDAAWKHAQKTFHARSMQDMEEQLDVAQAEVEALRAEVVELRNLRADAIHECALANIRAELMAEALKELITWIPSADTYRRLGFDPEAPMRALGLARAALQSQVDRGD